MPEQRQHQCFSTRVLLWCVLCVLCCVNQVLEHDIPMSEELCEPYLRMCAELGNVRAGLTVCTEAYGASLMLAGTFLGHCLQYSRTLAQTLVSQVAALAPVDMEGRSQPDQVVYSLMLNMMHVAASHGHKDGSVEIIASTMEAAVQTAKTPEDIANVHAANMAALARTGMIQDAWQMYQYSQDMKLASAEFTGRAQAALLHGLINAVGRPSRPTRAQVHAASQKGAEPTVVADGVLDPVKWIAPAMEVWADMAKTQQVVRGQEQLCACVCVCVCVRAQWTSRVWYKVTLRNPNASP